MSDLNLKLLITATTEGAVRSVGQVDQAIRVLGGGVKGAVADLAHIGGALALFQQFAAGPLAASRGAAQAVDELRGVEARVRLASASLLEFRGNLVAIQAAARELGTSVASVAALFNRVATPIRDMGGSADDARAAMVAVGQALRISGVTAGESASAMLQFAQALGSGALRGEELNSILENAPRLASAVAAGLGVTVGELKKLGEQGALTSQQVLKSLQSQRAALAGEAASLPQTVGQAWTNLSEAVKGYLAQLDQVSVASSAVSGSLSALAGNVAGVADAMRVLAVLSGAAIGGRMLASIAAAAGALRVKGAAARLAAADDLRHAEAAVAAAQAVRQGAITKLDAVAAARAYAVSSQAAALADQKQAAAAQLLAGNRALVAAVAARTAAQTAVAAASVGLLGQAMGLAATAGRGLLALVGGPIGLLVTAATAAALAWDYFRGKAKDAEDATRQSTEAMVKEFEAFSSKVGPNELGEGLSKLKDRAAELRDKLLDPAFRLGKMGQAAAAELSLLEAAITRADAAVTTFVNNRGKERGLLGIESLKLDTGGLVEADSLQKLRAFGDLYQAVITGAKNDNGQLVASALELKAALQSLFAAAKTPAEFTGLVDRLSKALAAAPKDATLRSALESAIEARSQAELKALNGLVAGLEARAARVQGLFSVAARVALGQFSQAAALARAAAELRNDTAGVSQVDAGERNAEVVAAKAGADLQVAALEEVAARKRAIARQQAVDIKAQADAETAVIRKAVDARLAAAEEEVREGKRTAGSLKDLRADLAKELTTKTAVQAAARVAAEGNAARQVREIDAETARQRATIAAGLYETLKSKAAEALAAYRSYAQQVISLDGQIVNNRLNTAAAINNLKRQDMTPKEQAESLKNELAQVKRETASALAEGKQDLAKDLLQRQQGLAQNIGSLSGEGIDPKEQRQQAIAELSRIGRESDAILQEQKASAEAAAAKQLEQFNQMTTAMNGLAQQITKLNEQAAIKIKPEIDQGALGAALEAVKTAFAGLVVPIRVQAAGLPDSAAVTPPELPARAYGGPLPGSAPHDRADNMLYWGTPGEWVMQLPAVRYYGADFMRRLNAMQLPRYADGGLLSRLRVPSLSPAPAGGGAARTPVNLVLDGRHYPMAAAPDVVAEMTAALGREALKRGARR